MVPTVTEPTALGELRPLLELVPSPLNPRKHFDKTKLEELAASIASKGIIEPLVVRRTDHVDAFEIVAGERRYRAAKLAGHDVVPVIIRTLADVEVLELMAIENSQRDDLHPLEEAEGYRALMKADRAYTPEAIAAKIGKSKRYVQQRLALGRLGPAVKKAFFDDTITAGHADLISRLKPADQAAALKACFHAVWNQEEDEQEKVCISVRDLDRWIENNVRIEITPDDPQTAFLPELADVVATPEAATILQVASGYLPESLKKQILGTALSTDQYRRINGKKDRCTHAQRAVIVIGDGRGKFLEVCTARTECKTHWKWEIETAARIDKEKKAAKTAPGARPTHSPKASAAEKTAKARRAADEAKKQMRDRVLDAAIKQFDKVAPAKPVPALIPLLAEAMPAYLTTKNATTWKALAVNALTILREDCFGDHEYKGLAKLVKPLGLDLAAIEKELAPKAEVAQTSAPKKAKGKK